jgi:DNA repair protein RadC
MPTTTQIITMPLHDLPENERPREKLLAHGPQALSDAELLALLLRTGIKGKSVLEVAREMLAQFGGVSAMLHAAPAELRAVKGLGPAKYAELAAVIELAKRSLAEEMKSRALLNSPQAVHDYLRLWLGGRPYEAFAALWLDTKHQLISADELFRGTLTQASVYPREVVKRALALNAAGVIFSHNHPSGSAELSQADEALTKTLVAALKLVDIKVVDHIIVSANNTVSFAQRGLL